MLGNRTNTGDCQWLLGSLCNPYRIPFDAAPVGSQPVEIPQIGIRGAIVADIGILLAMLGCSICVAGPGVEVKGTTNTAVSTDAFGMVAITPATPQHDVSYNAFNRFDISKSGATFLNSAVKARTIVAEVFSASPSRIEGPVSVDGPTANLILANQNGIRVNGGSFINFGSVALTTGAVALDDQQLSPGYIQRYVDISTHSGDIQIEAGGLQADLIHLELIAKQVGISGPITNAYTSPTAVTRIVAGDSKATFDTAASPTDNLTPWVYYAPGDKTVTGIAVDIAAASNVTSGRIEILVTDQGAGVRNAGGLLATAGDFKLTSSGRIEQLGGHVSAARDVRIQGASFAQTNQDSNQSSITAGQSVRLDMDGNIHNIGGVITGEMRNPNDSNTPYAVMLNAGGSLLNSTLPGGMGAIIFGDSDDVGLLANGAVSNVNARVVSNKALLVQSGGDFLNETLYTPGTGRSDWSHDSRTWLVLTDRQKGYRVDLGSLQDSAHMGYLVSDGALTIVAPNVQNLGGYIFSNNGDVRITAEHTVKNQAESVGEFNYKQSCILFLCHQDAFSTATLVGGQINAGAAMNIKAGDQVINDGGSILAVGDNLVEAPQIIAKGRQTGFALLRSDGLKAAFGDTWAKIYAADQGGGFTSQQGRLILHGTAIQERGFFVGAKEVDGVIQVVEAPQRDPISIEDHLGIFFW